MVTQPGTAQGPVVVYVSFSAEINANTTESLIATLAQLGGIGETRNAFIHERFAR
jgi:hypothetical protein